MRANVATLERAWWPLVACGATGLAGTMWVLSIVTYPHRTNPTPFELSTPRSTQWIFIGLVVPFVLFVNGDALLTSSSWAWLGRLSVKPSTSKEPERLGRFVLRPLSAYSSHAHIAAGAYACARAADARASASTMLFGATLLALGTASLVWWSSRRWHAQKLDNLLMEAHSLALAIELLSVALPAYEHYLIAAALAGMAVRAVVFSGQAELLPYALILIGCMLFSAASLGGSGQLEHLFFGLVLVLTGLLAKAADHNGTRCPWGTAALHYLSAAGVVLIWCWSQTLPAA
jgi:hypothetical protein